MLFRSRSSRAFATTAFVAGVALIAPPADAATIAAAYADGHRDVLVNDYGTPALGTFRLADGDTTFVALCLEAHVGHTTVTGAYRPVSNVVTSPELDYLLWRYGSGLQLDDDTATALAALAWFHASAQRNGGGAVWADHARGFAPITPLLPAPWNALPRFSAASPVGLVSKSGVHLDAAERRLHVLHLEAAARRGPWQLGHVELAGRSLTASLTGPGGPIAGIEVAAEITGVTPDHLVAVTGADGVATFDLPSLPDGAYVELTAEAPGQHREWDGDGAIQRMATGMTDTVRESAVVPPLARFVRVGKTSTDTAFGVAGARFELRDSTGAVVTVFDTDAAGTTPVATIDPTAHPGPYALREVAAPPGLAAIAADLVLAEPLSTDPGAPSVITVENQPRRRPLAITKALSEPDVGPDDLSGFRFSVTRVADDREIGVLDTGPGGVTPAIDVTIGEHRVCEVDRPPWGAALRDPGCVSVTVDAGDGPVGLVYTNQVVAPRLSTDARDQLDGDRTLEHGTGTIVDTVSYAGLVPGTEYTLAGELHELDVDATPVPTGIRGATTFTPPGPDGTVDVVITVPGDPVFDRAVVFERLLVGDRLVAEHADPHDERQTIGIAPRVPTVTTSTTPSTVRVSTTVAAASPPAQPDRPLPHTGAGVAGRLADVATLVATAGMLLSAIAIGGRRHT